MAKEKTKTESAVAGKPGKPGKPPKPPKRPKRRGKDATAVQPGEGEAGKKRQKAVKNKRSKKLWKLVRLAVILFIALLIIAGAAFVLVYNQFGLRDKAFDAVISLDPRERARDKTLEDRQIELDETKQELDGREEGIVEREEELDTRENDLNAEEARLEALREQLANQETDIQRREVESKPRYLQPMTDEQLADMQRLAKVYSTMTPEEAAQIMSSLYKVEDIVAILYQMSNRNIAAILAVMDVSMAVEITEILLHE